MSFDDWEKRPNGDIAAQPFAGYSIASLPMAGIVKLDYFPDPEALSALQLSSIQLAVTGPQARELGHALLRLADKVDQQPLGTRQ